MVRLVAMRQPRRVVYGLALNSGSSSSSSSSCHTDHASPIHQPELRVFQNATSNDVPAHLESPCKDTNTWTRAHLPMSGTWFSLNYLIATCMAAVYCFLLSAPSFCMPSQPTRFPAFSSMPPMPCWLGSRFADAAFIASTACDLSCAPDAFHASAPVTFPMVSC